MKIVFRVDASVAIGSGHVMRCLTLADELRSDGSECHFIGRSGSGDLLEYIRQRGHDAHALRAADARATAEWDSRVDAQATRAFAETIRPDWLVVDHYSIDIAWEAAMRPCSKRILVIDDLADRAHDCDALLDQNVYVDASDRYSSLVPPHCERFIGPRFALLRQEFVAARSALRPRRFAPPLRMHVFFGGSDQTGETLRTLRCLPPEPAARLSILDVVIGVQNGERERIASTVSGISNARLGIQVSDMARHVAAADVGVGACGSAALERCSLGLPTLTLVTAENQRELAAGLAHHGAIALLGDAAAVSDGALTEAVASYLNHPGRLREISAAGMALFPGDIGGARPLATMMKGR